MNDHQQAAQAVSAWTPVVNWLAEVESTIQSAPTMGGIDDDQVSDTADTVRSARQAVAALVGEYVSVAGGLTPSQTASSTGSEGVPVSNRREVRATHPSEHVERNHRQSPQQPSGSQQGQQPVEPPQTIAGWS